MIRYIAHIFPRKVKKEFYRNFIYLNFKTNHERLLGILVIFSFVVSLILSLITTYFFKTSIIIETIIILPIILAIIHLLLSLKAESIGKRIESILPDALRIMASNLRAGLTIDKALLLASREEFGEFNKEINKVGKEITVGKDITESLSDMSKRIRSKRFEETIEIIVSGIKSGGELATLLECTAHNLKEQDFVSQKVRSAVMMYFIFIFVAVGLASPFLFGLSSFLVEVLRSVMGLVSVSSDVSAISLNGVNIDPRFITNFSVLSLVTSSVLGSFVLGLIDKGSEKDGLKYVPFLILMSISIFFLSRLMMKAMLGGLFGF